MTDHGKCRLCGQGTKRVQADPCENATALFELTKIERARQHRVERFEAYYEERQKELGQTLH